jgi:hypothetical protein
MSLAETYPPHVAAKAAGTTTKIIRRRLDHRSIELQGCDRKSTGSGDWVGFSRNRILQIAIIEYLTKLGVSVSRASRAALTFTDNGQTGRAPGELFEHCKTILVIGPEGAAVKNFFFGASLDDVSNRSACAITVDLNRVVELVDTALSEIS